MVRSDNDSYILISMFISNHLLFSEAFFQQIRGETQDLDNLRATLSTIRSTWQYYLPPPDGWSGLGWVPESLIAPDDVGRLRKDLIEQVFAYLQLTYGPCETDERAFLLYSDWDRQDCTGLCLVLPYSIDIEGRDTATGRIPKGHNHAQQLMRLLEQNNLDWGVLTNARQWRLLHRTEVSPTEAYLQVDLDQVVANEDIQDYIVFHRFFSQVAFAREDGHQRLGLYKEQSDQATRAIESHLSAHKEEITRQLCQGLVESCQAAGEDVTAPESRAQIYKNALFLVYRLLFILYAEARRLLPLDNSTYRQTCLQDLLAEILDHHAAGTAWGKPASVEPTGQDPAHQEVYEIWNRLGNLFALIDQGNSVAGVPAYNGGLFDPGRRPFLTGHRIRNEFLQSALLRLCAVPVKGKSYEQDRHPYSIDFRDLSVRHLGSLYEGLLEYNLFLVEGEPRVVRVSEKRTQYVPLSQAGKVKVSETVLQVGEVYFAETEGERKASGSYYTPEGVVDYIVRNTVGAKLAEIKATFYGQNNIPRQLADLAATPPGLPAHGQIQRALDEQYRRFIQEQVLALRILDPAMGSGHFLVNAAHIVANFIVDLLGETDWVDVETDSDVVFWKRQVTERCLFGVDLNELAVELAKLCLWMTTAAQGKPLTFLDHHLRWGNSLVGSWLKDVGTYPLAKKENEQTFTLPLERFQVALDDVLTAFTELYAKRSDDVDEVRAKARQFNEEIYPALQPYRELLDLHTAVYFGVGPDVTTYAALGNAVSSASTWEFLKATKLELLLAQTTHQRWLHWEVEFPEVFAGEHKGFDAVVGNPPYVRQEKLADHKNFYQSAYLPIYHGSADLYVYFLYRGAENLRTNGLLGYILPNKWLRADYAGLLRECIINNFNPSQLLDFMHSKIFPETDTFPCILILGEPGNITSRLLYADVSDRTRKGRSLHEYVRDHGFQIPYSNLHKSEWVLEHQGVSDLLSKLRNDYPKLGQRKGVDAFFGIKTGFDAAFLISAETREQLLDGDPQCEKILRKLLRGRTIRRWQAEWNKEYLIGIPSSNNQIWPWSNCEDNDRAEEIFRQTYPSIFQHLKQYEDKLHQRQDKGRFWWELRSCSYYDVMEKPKIVVQQILYQSGFAMDELDYWANPKVWLISTHDYYYLAVLNSRLMWWYIFRSWPHMKDEALAVTKKGLLSLPIPEIDNQLRLKIDDLAHQAYTLAIQPEKIRELYNIELQLNDLVMEAYGLSLVEVEMINSTLPLRDPLVVLESRSKKQVAIY